MAYSIVRSLGDSGSSVMRLLNELMYHGDLANLHCMRAALLEPAHAGILENKAALKGLPVAMVPWLGSDDPERQAFATDWMRDFKSSSAIAFQALRHSLRTLDEEFDLERAKQLTRLAFEGGFNVGGKVSGLLGDLLNPNGDFQSPPDSKRVAYFEDLLGMDPLGDSSLPRTSRAVPVTLLLTVCFLERTEWLDALARVYSTAQGQEADHQRLRIAGREVVGAIIARVPNGSSSQILRGVYNCVARGWMEDRSSNALLAASCLFDGNESVSRNVRASYGGLLAYQSQLDEEGLTKALETVRGLHAAGADLDTVARVENKVTSMRSWHSEDEQPEPLTWTGTMLHAAVDEGDPALVALLLQMGCDPARRATVEDIRGNLTSYDCLERISQIADLDADHVRREAVELMLRSWKANRHAIALIGQNEPPIGDRGPSQRWAV